MRALLIHQYFGPYHVARWKRLRALSRVEDLEVIGLELFRNSKLYQWTQGDSAGDLCRLSLEPDARDRMRWQDVRKLFSTLSSLEPSVVFINGWGMRDAVLVHLWCRLKGIPRVLVSDSQEIDKARAPLRERLKSLIISGAGSAFVAGTPHRRYVMGLGIDPETIVMGCDVVDGDHFSNTGGQRNASGSRLITMARWLPRKNLLAAAAAFLEFADAQPGTPWQWYVAGYGPLERELRETAAKSNGRIVLLGARSYEEIPRDLARADIYWQPSIEEPWGLAVNEAMSAGLPVLVSNRCGCHEDLVTPATGWTFDPMSHNAMVRALEICSRDRSRWEAMGTAAQRHIANWGLDRYAEGFFAAANIALGNSGK